MYRFILLLGLVMAVNVLFSQVNVILPESMYNGAGGINGDAIALWEANNRFENDSLTMSGTGDMRNTNPSNYPGASGTWNVMLNSAGEYFYIAGIEASVYYNLSLSLGIRKSTLNENGSGIRIEYSSDGLNWDSLSIILPTGTGSSGWHFVQAAGTIQPSATLSFRITSRSLQDFRIDDIRLSGLLPCSSTLTSFSPASGPPGTKVSISGTGFTGAIQVLFNGLAAQSFQILSDTGIKAIVPVGAGSGPITIFSNCAMNSLVNFTVISSSCALNGSNLILSELCDPVNNFATDRFIELFNPTSHAIDLNGWSVKAIANYLECETWYLSGLIQPAEAITCGNSTSVSGGPHDFELTAWNGNVPGSCCSFWNGNRRDGAALYHGMVKIDEALFENSTIGWFSDRSLLRKDTVCRPNPRENPMEWDISPVVAAAGSEPSSPGIHRTHCPGSPPLISVQPVSQEVCEGTDVSFTVQALPGTLPYQFEWMQYDLTGNWQVVQLSFPFTVNSGAAQSTLSIAAAPANLDQRQYYCRVTSDSGGCFTSSNAFSITILPLPSTSLIFHF
jgi:hypothetical protein